MKKLAVVCLLLVLLMVPSTMLFSKVDLCIRPKDVLSTERVYDQATGTYIQYRPGPACVPFYAPEDSGILYTRLQWVR